MREDTLYDAVQRAHTEYTTEWGGIADYLMHVYHSVDEFHNVLNNDNLFYQELKQVCEPVISV